MSAAAPAVWPGGLGGAARARGAEVQLPAVVRAVVEVQKGRGALDGLRVVADGVHVEGVVVGAGHVVVPGVLVGGAGDHGHAVAVGVVDGLAGVGAVVDGAEGLLHHLGAAVDGVHHGLREVVDLADEAVGDAHGDDHAARAVAGVALVVVGLRGGPAHLARAVAEARGVGGVVVVLEEVPAGDVVGVAVVVVVAVVGEHPDEVARVDDAVAVGVVVLPHGVAAHAGVAGHDIARAAGDAGVAHVVLHVDHAVAVGVVGRGAHGHRELAGVQRDLVDEVGVVPVDARVEHRDHHPGVADGEPPRAVEVVARPDGDLRGAKARHHEGRAGDEAPLVPLPLVARVVGLVLALRELLLRRVGRGRPDGVRGVRVERERADTQGEREARAATKGPRGHGGRDGNRIVKGSGSGRRGDPCPGSCPRDRSAVRRPGPMGQ